MKKLMEKLQEERSFKLIPLYLKALCIAFIISLIFILLLSIILSVTKVSEEIINPAIIFISMFSILFSSFMIAKKIKKNGIINGAIFGILYMTLLYLLSSLINMKFYLNFSSILMIGVGLLGGVIGGILGVNIH